MHFHSIVEQEEQLKLAQAFAYGRAFTYKEGAKIQRDLADKINTKLGIKPEPIYTGNPADAYNESIRVPSFMVANNSLTTDKI